MCLIVSIENSVFNMPELLCNIANFASCESVIQLSGVNTTARDYTRYFSKGREAEFSAFFWYILREKNIALDLLESNRFYTASRTALDHISYANEFVSELPMQRISQRFPRVSSIYFSNCFFYSPLDLIFTKFKYLAAIEIRSCSGIGDDLEMIGLCSQLTKLTISDNKKIKGSFFSSLPLSVTALRVMKCAVRDENLPCLDRLQKLKLLNLSHSPKVSKCATLPITITTLCERS